MKVIKINKNRGLRDAIIGYVVGFIAVCGIIWGIL